jgi:hypothetical protein
MEDQGLLAALEELQSRLQPLRQGEFSERIGKVSIYLQSIAKSWDAFQSALQSLEQMRYDDPEGYLNARASRSTAFRASLQNAIRFARLNLDAVLVQALESVVWRPRLASKADEQKKATALKKTFDRLERPDEAMLEHYRTSSDPLNKYLVAGPWGHDYLRIRRIDLQEYDRRLVEMLGCRQSAAGEIVHSYAQLCRAMDAVNERARDAS